MTSNIYISFFLNNYNFFSYELGLLSSLPLVFLTSTCKQFLIVLLNSYKIVLFKTNIINSVIFALKFLILIAILIFIRGGVPRYRYDFLTKIGWIKFLSILLFLFLSVLLFNYLF